jgi:hypothetical protein
LFFMRIDFSLSHSWVFLFLWWNYFCRITFSELPCSSWELTLLCHIPEFTCSWREMTFVRVWFLELPCSSRELTLPCHITEFSCPCDEMNFAALHSLSSSFCE